LKLEEEEVRAGKSVGEREEERRRERERIWEKSIVDFDF
jgi:hypothetical protein